MEENRNTKRKKLVAGVLGVLLTGTTLAAGGIIYSVGTKVETYSPLAGQGECTVLVYMVGSDLETDYGAAAADLAEMEQAVAVADPSGEKVHIVVEAGGAEHWQYGPMKPYQYGRFCITGKETTKVTDMEVRDMGREDTLADFINYGTQSYPAEHYGMIFWNHGAGQIAGFGKDDNFNGSSLSLTEIKNAFEKSAYEEAFDFIGMDACLMSSLELVSTLQGKTNYLIASEGLEPQDGYDYKWMENLTAESGQYGEKMGRNMVESYDACYKDTGYSYTLALIDINRYADFHDRFDEAVEAFLAYTQTEKEQAYQKMGRIRSRIQGFGQQDGGMSEQADLMELLEQMAAEDMYAADLYQSVSIVYEQMVVCRAYGGFLKEPGGVSIYLPNGDDSAENTKSSIYEEISFCKEYQSFVKEYTDYLSQTGEIIWEEPKEQNGFIVMEVEADQISDIADAYNAVYINKETFCYMIAADGDVTLDLSGFFISPMEDTFWGLKGEILCFIENYTRDGITGYYAPILYKKAGGDWEECRIKIVFSDGIPDGIIENIEPCEVSKQQYFLEEGDKIIPLYPVYDVENAKISKEQTYAGEYYKGNLIVMEDMEMGDGELEKITPGEETAYEYGFLIRDVKMNLYETELIKENTES